MGVSQKARSLHSGLQAGLGFTSLGGREVLLFSHVPFELEDALSRWLVGQSPDRKEMYVYQSEGLTLEGWSAFVGWMEETLRQALISNHPPSPAGQWECSDEEAG